MSWKLSRTVLRRGKGSNSFSLVDFIDKRYHIEVEKHGIIQSMNDAGNPYDNAIMESFNKSLKTEMMDGNKVFATREKAKKAIFEYIELFYNRKRRHSSLGYLSPIEYEKLNLSK